MLTKLYGRGAIVMNDDRRQYVMNNGCIELPDHLVNRALSMGLMRHPLPSIVEEEAVVAAPSPLPAITAGAPNILDAAIAIDAEGFWRASMTMEGVRSFRYGYDSTEAPPADIVAMAGLVVNGNAFEAHGDAPLASGEAVHLTVVPCGELEGVNPIGGAAIQLRGIRQDAATQSLALPDGHPQVAANTAATQRSKG